jgi:ethanolamine ammonia-lyase small subunit
MAEASTLDPFARLRAATPARIGLGRAGQSLPTGPMLAFQLAHARARDAVFDALDAEGLAGAVGPGARVVTSQAPDRETYLRRPDLGRRLDLALADLPRGDHDLAIVLADGLSARALAHAPDVVSALAAGLTGWRLAPIVIVRQGRVAIGDEIAERLGARSVVVLIGERPGLSAADSLGAYLTWDPKPGRLDSERNCVSNIRPEGLAPAAAAAKIAWLLTEARRLGFTGVALKDREGMETLPGARAIPLGCQALASPP